MLEAVPCPQRIADDAGSAFAMGGLGGAVWHFGKGLKNSPRGDRVRGGYQQMAMRAPTLGGNFAVWGGLFSFYDCLFQGVRGREDPWNAIAAGAATGGSLAARAGWKAVGKNAAIGGVLLAMIEGLGVLLGKAVGGPQQATSAPPLVAPPQLAMIPKGGGPGGDAMNFGLDDHSYSTEDFSFDDRFDFIDESPSR